MGRKFQILSLDGGGLKGLFSAAVLAHLESDLDISITDHFDLIVGTSTGGIIALGLGMGMRPKEIVDFYVDHGTTIFPSSLWKSAKQYYSSKYDASTLESALTECFGERNLGESRKRLVIPSFNLGENDVYLFKTPHHERLKRDYKVPMWKVAMATSAAPTYIPVYKGIDNVRLVDGGVWANNPIMVGIVEAKSMLNILLENMHVLSLGTTDEVTNRLDNLDAGGYWQWKTAAVDLVMKSQSIGTHTQALHLLGENKICRVNPKVPEGLFELDKPSREKLSGKAAHESRKLSPAFKELFMGHVADEYKPLYKNTVTD